MENFSVVARWQERAVAAPEQIREYTAAGLRLKTVQAELEKMRGSEIDAVLDDARRHTGDYVLAAGQQIRRERELAGLAPLGDQPNVEKTPGAILIEAESSRRLKPEFVAQWAGYLRGLRPDSGSVFAVWSEIASSDSMTSLSAPLRESLAVAEPSIPAAELARRYQDRCIRVLDASQGAQPRTEAGTDTRGTDKPAQQSNGVDDGLRQVLFDPRGPFAVPETIDAYFPAAAQDRLKQLRADIKSKEAAVPKLPEAMSVYNDVAQNVRIHFRGNHVTQGPEIRRRFPKIMTGDSPPVIAESSSGRLELARWLTSNAHPLTARVFVNRVWRGHFGEALVRTADNFGLLGEPPTHPELLDYLAVRFMEDGWSIKGLHRAILLSSAYQMSTAWNEKAAAVDPENRLLWRMNRRRLEVEAIRDALLAATGGLETQMGGSLLTTPNRLYVTSTASVNPDVYKPARRSVYLPVVRSALYDVFQAFDFPDPTTSNGERGNTTVAPQALFMMNAELTSVATRRWAQALLDDGQKNDVDRVRAIFAGAYGRPPREVETTLAVQFVESYAKSITAEVTEPKERQTRAWQALCRAILSANEFLYVE